MNQFLDEVVSWLERRDEGACRDVAAELSQFHDVTPRQVGPPDNDTTEMLPLYDQCVRSPDALSLAQALHRDAPALAWHRSLGLPMMHTEIVGPNGVFESDRFLFGSLLISPNFVYPLHSHAAHETYIVLSGEPMWWNSSAGYLPQVPGNVIVHEPYQPHAMRTANAPLLTLWAWQGDLRFETYRFEPAGIDENGDAI